jgi:hypothetical protein
MYLFKTGARSLMSRAHSSGLSRSTTFCRTSLTLGAQRWATCQISQGSSAVAKLIIKHRDAFLYFPFWNFLWTFCCRRAMLYPSASVHQHSSRDRLKFRLRSASSLPFSEPVERSSPDPALIQPPRYNRIGRPYMELEKLEVGQWKEVLEFGLKPPGSTRSRFSSTVIKFVWSQGRMVLKCMKMPLWGRKAGPFLHCTCLRRSFAR